MHLQPLTVLLISCRWAALAWVMSLSCSASVGVAQFMASDSSEVTEKSQKPLSRQLFNVSQAFEDWPEQKLAAFDRILVQVYTREVEWGSSDRLLIEEQLRKSFLQSVRAELLGDSQFAEDVDQIKDAACVWRLISLRKRGSLPRLGGKVKPTVKSSPSPLDLLQAEIASRRCEEWFEATLDRVLVDSEGRRFFESVVHELTSDSTADPDGQEPKVEFSHSDSIRAAALRLRKSRRLRPELSAKLIDWEIQQFSFPATQLISDLTLIPRQPGIYLFRDATGYLYIGEAIDLRQRMQQHLSESDRQQLAVYLEQEDLDSILIDLHVFPSDSPGRTLGVRRAYESELIRSRKPRFNIRP